MKCWLLSSLLSLLLLSSCDEWQLTRTASADTITDMPDDAGRSIADTATGDMSAVDEQPETYEPVPRGNNILAGTPAATPTAAGTADPNRVYRFSEVDSPPLFSADCRNAPQVQVCSEQAVAAYFSRNVLYPTEAKSARRESVQYVSFTLDASGRVDAASVQVVTAEGETCPSCARTAVDAVRAMPDWVPAQVGGQSVPVELFLPVRFNINRI